MRWSCHSGKCDRRHGAAFFRNQRWIRTAPPRVQATVRRDDHRIAQLVERLVNIKDKHWYAATLEQAKIEGIAWHTLRHAFASRLMVAGVDLETLQELRGYKYAHRAPTHKLTLVRSGLVSAQIGYQRQNVTQREKK